MEQRLQCTSCNKVRYRTDTAEVLSVAVPAVEKGKNEEGKVIYEDVRLTDCVKGVLGKEGLEYSCPECKKSVNAVRWVRMSSLFSAALKYVRVVGNSSSRHFLRFWLYMPKDSNS